MEKLIGYDKLRSISVEVETGRPISRSKYPHKLQSELIPRRTELKIVKLDEQIISSPLSANVVNLEFGEEGISLFKRVNRRPPKRHQNGQNRKGPIMYKEMGKTRYQNLLKAQNNIFCKQTMMITPYVQSINTESYLNDMYAKRRLINIEKLTFPYRQTKRQASTRSKYRAPMNKTSRTLTKEDFDDIKSKHNCSHLEEHQRTSSKLHSQTHCVSDFKLLVNNDIKPDYKKEVSTLIPIRKPSNKKDYFVFGLSDRNNTPENKIEMYRDMLWKVNYSNGLYVLTPDNIKNPYKFYVGEGNNSNLIRGIMKRRFWWVQASCKNQQDLNFVWTQLKVNSLFCTQQIGSVPQYFVADRAQSDLTLTASAPSENHKDIEEDSHKKIFGRLDYKIWRNHLAKNQKTENKISESTYHKRVKMYEKKKITKIEDSKNLKVHNHLQQNYYIGNKKALYYNVKRYLQLKGEDPFKMLPLTFHITKGIEDAEYQQFLQVYSALEDYKKKQKGFKNIWIVKPGQNTNRGNGITVCYGLDDIKLRLKGRQRNADGKLRTFILQKYIENPLLYHKRKFDLRHYVLITCINGSFKGYWYEQGYVRTSSAQFNLRPNKDSMIHLTNDAIQKNNPEYGKYEKANKLSYSDLHKYIQSLSASKNVKFYEDIIPKMKHFATQAIKATYFILDSNRRKHNFELLGLDFMIDEEYQPWLIEINTNPCLQLCCPLLQRLIPSVVQNTFKICVDPLFPPPQVWPNNRKPFFGDDPVGENKFELIFEQSSHGQEVQKLLRGYEKIDSKMGRIQQDDETFQNEGQLDWQKE